KHDDDKHDDDDNVTTGVVPPANAAPDAVDDTLTTNEDSSVTTGNVLTNDTDLDGNTLSVGSFTQASNGTVADNGDGTFTYTPNADFNGNDSFTYTVTDGNGGTDTATVNVAVNADTSTATPPTTSDDQGSDLESAQADDDAQGGDDVVPTSTGSAEASVVSDDAGTGASKIASDDQGSGAESSKAGNDARDGDEVVRTLTGSAREPVESEEGSARDPKIVADATSVDVPVGAVPLVTDLGSEPVPVRAPGPAAPSASSPATDGSAVSGGSQGGESGGSSTLPPESTAVTGSGVTGPDSNATSNGAPTESSSEGATPSARAAVAWDGTEHLRVLDPAGESDQVEYEAWQINANLEALHGKAYLGASNDSSLQREYEVDKEMRLDGGSGASADDVEQAVAAGATAADLFEPVGTASATLGADEGIHAAGSGGAAEVASDQADRGPLEPADVTAQRARVGAAEQDGITLPEGAAPEHFSETFEGHDQAFDAMAERGFFAGLWFAIRGLVTSTKTKTKTHGDESDRSRR
ncbi:MAG: cadherin-like domain-containing protein, partial [Phycisphaerae bacterium]